MSDTHAGKTDTALAGTSSSPVYQQFQSSQPSKRKNTATVGSRRTKRKICKPTGQQEAAENRVDDGGNARGVLDQPEAAENRVDDGDNARGVLDQPEAAENRVDDGYDARGVLDQPEAAENRVDDGYDARGVLDQPEAAENRVDDGDNARGVLDQPEAAENRVDDGYDARGVLDQPEAAENRVDDGYDARGVLDQTEAAENRVDDGDDARSVLDQQEGQQQQRDRIGRRARRRLPIWQWNRIYPRGPYTPRNITFTGNEGIEVPLPPNPTAEDFFKLYITEDIIDHIVTQTNLYAQQYIDREQNNLRPYSLVKQWKPTDRQEMIAFLAILILMGIIHKPRINMYWSTDTLLSTPIFSQLMGRDRFLLLLRFLHFADNRNHNPNDPDRDRLYKVREVTDMIRRRCSSVYYPGKKLSVDESLVLFKGRVTFKQYIKTKRARFGIKLFQLCTSDGIVLDFLIYHGNMAPHLVELEDSLVTERIAVTLMQKYLGKGHHLYVDNYYTSVSLAKYLLQNETYITGTIRDHRKHFPTELKRAILDKGESAYFHHDNIVVMKYRAHKNSSTGKPKIVHLLTTSHRPAQANTTKRDRDGNIFQKPTCIIDYNYNMGGVDTMDQQLDAIDVLRKSYKWYKKLFLRLIMQCVLASHKLYKKQGGRNEFLLFMLDLCGMLLQNCPRLEGKPPADNLVRLTGRNHFPGKREAPDWNKMKSRTKKCRVCAARGIKTQSGNEVKTAWICKACPGEPGLCVDKECFEIFHTKFDISQ